MMKPKNSRASWALPSCPYSSKMLPNNTWLTNTPYSQNTFHSGVVPGVLSQV
ncbi:hypothetical protein D9M68_956450 [compost metagenome]